MSSGRWPCSFARTPFRSSRRPLRSSGRRRSPSQTSPRPRLLLERLEHRLLLSVTEDSDRQPLGEYSRTPDFMAQSVVFRDAAPAVRADTHRPSIVGVTPLVGTVGLGQALQVAVRFNEAVAVTGVPSALLRIGRKTIEAAYVGRSGQSTLLFEHVVSATTPAATGQISLRAVTLAKGVSVADLAGNPMQFRPPNAQGRQVNIDPIAPLVRSVTTATPGLHGVGDTVVLKVRFSEKVSFDRPPQLRLGIGERQYDVPSIPVQPSETLTFRYTVKAGDEGPNGLDVSKLVLPDGGYLRDRAGNAASLNAPVSLVRQARVDGRAPVITKIHRPATPVRPGSFVVLDVTFDEPVVVQGKPRVELKFGQQRRSMVYAGPADDGARTMRFRYRATAKDGGDELPVVASTILMGQLSSIRDAAGNDAQTSLTVREVPSPTLGLVSDTGSSSSDGITRDGRLTVGGLELGATWEYSTDGGTQWQSGSGSGFTLGEGTYQAGAVRVRQADAAGNLSNPASMAAAVKVDLTVPAILTSALVTDTGSSSSDGITRDGNLTVGGIESGATWEYSTDGGTQWQSGSGNGFTLREGIYQSGAVRVHQTDTAGNLSNPASMAAAVTVDLTAPARPAAVAYRTISDSGITVNAERNAHIVAFSGMSSTDISTQFQLAGVTPVDATQDSSRLSSLRVGRFATTVVTVDRAGNQSVASDVVEFTTPVRGVLVDGYIGGSTVFQDANDNWQLDDGELGTVATSFGEFTLDIADVVAGPIRVVGGLDIGSNEPVTITLGIPAVQVATNVITPLSTIAAAAGQTDATIPTDVMEVRIASLFGISLSAAPGGTLFGYDPIAVLRSSNPTESASARQVYAANQMVVALGHTLGSVLHRTAADVRGGIIGSVSQLAVSAGVTVPGGVAFVVPAVWDVVAQDAMIKAMAEIVAASMSPSVLDGESRASLLTKARAAAEERMVGIFLGALQSSSLVTSEGSRTYADFLRNTLGVTDLRAFVESSLSGVGGRGRSLLAVAVENRIAAWQQAMTSAGSAEDLARAITVISVGAKYFEMQSLGDLLDAAGNPVVGQTPQSVLAAITTNADAMSATAQEAIGDVLGVDTRTRYSDAVIRVLSDGADDFTGTDASEIIAARRGTNVVRGYGGNDRVLGGSGVDSLSGGEGDDELFGFRGDDILDGNEGDDFISAGAGNDLINGGTGDDTILGESGDDTISGGGGSDYILGGNGNDTMTVGGDGGRPFSTYVDGGAGTNTLAIIYDEVSSLADFTTRRMTAEGVLVLTDSSGGEFSIKNIGLQMVGDNPGSGLTIGSTSYQIANWREGNVFGDGYGLGAAISVTAGEVVLFDNAGRGFSVFNSELPWPRVSGKPDWTGRDTAFTVYGTSQRDIVRLGQQADVVYTGEGNDVIFGGGGGDSIFAGEGSDVFMIRVGQLAQAVVIDGGNGEDTINFLRQRDTDFYSQPAVSVVASLGSLGAATGIENLVGDRGNDTLTGDGAANVLIGVNGLDTLIGGEGDDSLFGEYDPSDPSGMKYHLRWQGDGWEYEFGYGDDTLLGGAGRDRLFGNGGNDTLDGGTDADYLEGGTGSDTFVLCVGDGGATIADADVIADFQDGTDVLGLTDGLTYQSLVITQGNGTDTAVTNVVIRTTAGEFLATIRNTQATSIGALDFSGTTTNPLTLTGTTGSDTLIGAAGNDTISGGGGSDYILGGNGDDTITVGGNGGRPFVTVVDGGAGTNTLAIVYDEVSSLADFTTRRMTAEGVLVLTDSSGGEFSIKNIGIAPRTNTDAVPAANLSVAGRSYQFMDTNGEDTIHGGGYSKGAAVSVASGEVVLYSSGYDSYSTFHASRPRPDGSLVDTAFVIHGVNSRDIISGGNLGDTIYGNGGDDEIYAMGGADSVYAGDGNDVVFVKLASLAEDLVIDGGDGSDTLSFDRVINLDYAGGYPPPSSVTVDMASLGVAVGFENIVGGIGSDRISGDAESNVLIGLSGSDAIDGRGGNDTLYGDWQLGEWQLNEWGLLEWWQPASGYGIGDTWSSSAYNPAGNDTLRGGAGSDAIYGNGGNDVLDGGHGADRLTGGSGIDTFVLRIGDGGIAVVEADKILDFQNNTDVLGLADGLTYQSLVIRQGSGADVAITDVVIRTTAGEFLAVIRNAEAMSISALQFQQYS